MEEYENLFEKSDIYEDDECKLIYGYIKGTHEIHDYLINSKNLNKNILSYSMVCKFEECELYTVDISFESGTELFIFLLGEKYELISFSINVHVKRVGIFVNISSDQQLHNIRIKYRCIDTIIDNEVFRNLASGWLLKPLSNWNVKKFKIEVDQHFGYYGNIQVNALGNYDIDRIALVTKRSRNDEYLIIKDGLVTLFQEIRIETSLSIQEELIKFCEFYFDIFGEPLNVTLLKCDSIPAICLSYEGLIIFSSELLELKSSALFQFLFHEFIHQIIGNKLLFAGEGYLWLKESFTEYIQLIYLQKRFGDNIYSKRIKHCKEKFFCYYFYEIPMVDTTENMESVSFISTIATKGLLLYDMLFVGNVEYKIEEIKKAILKMRLLRRRVCIHDFLDIVEDNNQNVHRVRKLLFELGL